MESRKLRIRNKITAWGYLPGRRIAQDRRSRVPEGLEAGRNATARRSAGIRAVAANETGDCGTEELLATPRWALFPAAPGEPFLGGTAGLA